MNITHEWRCLRCGAWNPDRIEVTHCVSCGAARPDVAEYRKVPLLRKLRRRAPTSRYLRGWFCLACGHDNPDEETPCADLTECQRCGTARPEVAAAKRAPTAGWQATLWATALSTAGVLWLGLMVKDGWIIGAAVALMIWGDQVGRRR